MKEVLIMDTRRNGYGPDQCNETMTVGGLIDLLQEYDEVMEVFTGHDNRYTYGSITRRDFDTMEIAGEEEEE